MSPLSFNYNPCAAMLLGNLIPDVYGQGHYDNYALSLLISFFHEFFYNQINVWLERVYLCHLQRRQFTDIGR